MSDDYFQADETSSVRPSGVSGFVYLLRSPHGFKIGCARNPSRRIAQFVTMLPFEITIDHTIPAPDMYAAEWALHGQFQSKRIRGEWFSLDETDVAEIKRMVTHADIPYYKAANEAADQIVSHDRWLMGSMKGRS